MRTFEWAIEDIIMAYPGLGLGEYAAMAVALMKGAAPPAEFHVEVNGFTIDELDGDDHFQLRVTWNTAIESDSDRIERTRQRPQIIEGAAIGLAFLLFAHLIPDSEMQIAVVGDRVDFWLPRLHRALEISGTQRPGAMPRRFRDKRRQVLENLLGWDGFVVLCCFAERQRLVQWSYHMQEE